MGLLGTGLKIGAIYAITTQGIKAYENHKDKKQQHSYAQNPYGPQTQTRDVDGYPHQSWCNGQCQNQCNGSGYAHQPYCGGQCGLGCNGEQGQMIPAVESCPRMMDEKVVPVKY